jgi:hypothetical protein
MKGKRIDAEFITQFIEECIQQQYLTPEEIVVQAQSEINQIDQKILEAEQLKIRRSKLLDIISTFQKPVKIFKDQDLKIISFLQIGNPDICKFICNQLKKQACTKDQLINTQFSIYDFNFCIKQLIEHKVITKIGDTFLRGVMFEEYLRIVLRENNVNYIDATP